MHSHLLLMISLLAQNWIVVIWKDSSLDWIDILCCTSAQVASGRWWSWAWGKSLSLDWSLLTMYRSFCLCGVEVCRMDRQLLRIGISISRIKSQMRLLWRLVCVHIVGLSHLLLIYHRLISCRTLGFRLLNSHLLFHFMFYSFDLGRSDSFHVDLLLSQHHKGFPILYLIKRISSLLSFLCFLFLDFIQKRIGVVFIDIFDCTWIAYFELISSTRPIWDNSCFTLCLLKLFSLYNV